MATFSDESLEIVGTSTTAWLPISSAWLSIAACSSQIYAQRAGLGGNLIAFDPLYGESIIPSAIPCLPTEVTSSWYQSDSATTTVLGPTFVCPGAYSAVETLLINSFTQQILCCPSSYALNSPITGKQSFPSQCTSSLTSGQTLTYESTTPGGPWGVATSTVPASTAVSTGPTIVYGMHVNGFNVIANSTAIGSSTTPTSTPVTSSFSSGSSIPTSSSPASSSPASSTASKASSLSTGAAAGIGVGVACLAVAALLGVWLFVRKRRRAKQEHVHTPGPGPYEADSTDLKRALYETDGTSAKRGPYEVDNTDTMKKPRVRTMHELPAN